MRLLVTGAAGYIGSHTCVELLNQGHEVVGLDNFVNSHPASLEAVAEIVDGFMELVEVDLLDAEALDKVFAANDFEAVLHFAGLKAVGESVEQPIRYYRNNIVATLNLLDAMAAHDVKQLIFSSSATVYGENDTMPLVETMPVDAKSPYGKTKQYIEGIIEGVAESDPEFKAISLRYFNPIGAHPSGKIGDDPQGIPNNLMPYLMQVLVGRREKLSVFGDDYSTPDGTGLRDYIHVVDLAKGHVAALDAMDKIDGALPINLGTGTGSSVLDIVAAAGRAADKAVPYEITERRAGDVARLYADASRAKELLGWEAELGLDEMCADHWRWQSTHPHGFSE